MWTRLTAAGRYLISPQFQRLLDQAAALAYYFLLSLFPACLVIVSLLSLFAVDRGIDSLWFLKQLPAGASSLVQDVIKSVEQTRQTNLLSLASIAAIWIAGTGILALIREINRVYKIKETRSILRLRLTSVFILLVFGALTGGPFLLYFGGKLFFPILPEPLSRFMAALFASDWLRYLLLGLSVYLGFAFLYRIAPPDYQQIGRSRPGALFATLSLLVVTQCFELYLRHYGRYEILYGSIGTIIGLLIWLFLLGLVLLVGAKLNRRLALKHQAPQSIHK